MAGIGLYVFGTSILWGQGHDEETKIHSRIKSRLETKYGAAVRLRHFPHSGAVLKGRAGKNRKRLHGEVPDPWPSVATQVAGASPAAQKKVVVLVDGGINDVGVFNIINPFYPRRKLVSRTKRHCYHDLLHVLSKIGRKYRGADTYVLGYYPILASRIGKNTLERLLFAMRICESEDLAGVDFVSRAVGNSTTFWRESSRQMQKAAERAHEEASVHSGSVTFVPSGFKVTEGLFGRRSLLFGLGKIDPQFDDRLFPCTRAIVRGRSGFHCQFAATGHPNKLGVLRYVKNLKSHMGI